MIRRLLCCAAVLLLAAGPAPAAHAKADDSCVAQAATFSYGSDGPQQQVVRATWNPCRTAARWVLLVHGGSWLANSALPTDVVNYWYQRGWQVMNIDYRRGPKVPFTDQRDDVVAAWDWVVRHNTDLQLNPRRGVAFGVSAGGHLAAWLGNLRHPAGIISLSGVLQPQLVATTDRLQRGRTPQLHTLHLREVQMMGCDWKATMPVGCRKAWREFQPAGKVTRRSAPTFLIQAKDDSYVPWQTAPAYAKTLTGSRVPSTVVLLRKGGHGLQVLARHPDLRADLTTWAASLI